MELKGQYIVYFKHPRSDRREDKFTRFIGECENFNGSGNWVFRNDKDEFLIVQFQDIIQLKPYDLK